MFKVESYLTEKKLGAVLRAWAGDKNVIAEAKVPGTRMRYDYEVKRGDRTICVEFDGDSHFRDANVIFRDWSKDKISERLGKEVVRIPYFIQLTKETFPIFFGEKFDISSDYPHGFIASKMLPASFCPTGHFRAKIDIDKMPSTVRDAIFLSLEKKAEELGEHFTYFQNFVSMSDEADIPWREFVRRAREVHGDTYEYPHPL